MEGQPCWEYCQLYFRIVTTISTKTHTYTVLIWFMSSHGDVIEREIATSEQSFPFDPWLKAIGLLGGSSWELVTVKVGSDPAITVISARQPGSLF